MVSIIIPVYNTSRYLNQALDSVINQTYRNLQIICVNDGSTDNSLSILKEYARKDERIEIISLNNSGPSAARNHGLKKARGEYIAFLDSDDWMDLDTIENARTLMIKNNTDIVLWGYQKEYGSQSIPVYPWHDNLKFEKESMLRLTIRLIGLNGEELKNPELQDSIGTAWGKLYRRELFSLSNCKFTDTGIIGSAEDVLFNAELFTYAKSAYFSKDIIHHYRKNNEAAYTRTYKKDLISQWEHLFSFMQDLIMRYQLGETALVALENRKALALIGLGLNELSAESSFSRQVKRIKSLLAVSWLQNALNKLPLRYFPPHWKLFFHSAKTTNSLLVTLLMLAIKRITSK